MTGSLSKNFRKKSPEERRKELQQEFSLTDRESLLLSNQIDLSDLSNLFIESSIGTFPIPIGIATGFLIDGKETTIPMATEEPSVIMAASYGALLISRGGGFQTWADPSITSGQIFLLQADPKSIEGLKEKEWEIGSFINSIIPNMVSRGGGFRGIDAAWSEDRSTLCATVNIDVQNAMGANCVNTVVEELSPLLEKITSGKAVMKILTNSALKRKAGASFSCSADLFKPGICEKIVDAAAIANRFPERAMTHNKGIMNGISALALATGNDTRSIEAAAHFYAQRNGTYQPLSDYALDSKTNTFSGELTLPLAMGTVGGATNSWPPSAASFKILSVSTAQQLARIGAALGLAQNLAALLALVTDGIQQGHMKLHNRRPAT